MTTLNTGRCHCGRNQFKIPFATSSLPKVEHMCHCNICRHCTGSMGVVDPVIDGKPLSIDSTEDNHLPADFSNLTEYRSSSLASRLFCSTCSAHMFFRSRVKSDSWTILSGCLEKIDGVVTVIKHIYLADTLDGGIADHFQEVGDKSLRRYHTWGTDDEPGVELPPGWRAEGHDKNPDTLPLHCQCRSIQLYLTRATRLSDNPEDYWLIAGKEATDHIRFKGTHCLCNDCRLSNGTEIASWLVVPDENIFDRSTNAPVNVVDKDKRPKALKQYMSSNGRYRESCVTCGATVFWWRDMRDGESPHMNVAAGLVDEAAVGGARAEPWIQWHDQPLFSGSALSKHTAKAVEEGLKAFKAAR
ncbi:hypothetical protein NMY22_g9721 [Coprinellus aureogranulatus]|nr:hypothetical protein NMY22_g9721 [Coprinellus aureogranulatus]